MSFASNTATQRPGIMHSIQTTLADARSRMAQRRAFRQTVTALSQLSNHELEDLGLSRGSISADAYQAVYGTRSTR